MFKKLTIIIGQIYFTKARNQLQHFVIFEFEM